MGRERERERERERGWDTAHSAQRTAHRTHHSVGRRDFVLPCSNELLCRSLCIFELEVSKEIGQCFNLCVSIVIGILRRVAKWEGQ
jgi:hypothetical protein